MKNALNSIEEIQNSIFDFDIKTAMYKVSELIEDLIVVSSKLSETSLNKFMNIMNSINTALDNKDYLLYCDILEFQLKPFLKTEEF